MDVRADLLSDQNATANNANLLGDIIPAPSPRQTTQSPETHQLQQTLQNNANEQVHLCSFPNDSGDGASAFSTVSADDALTRSPTVETVLETGSDDGQDNVDLGRNV